MKWLTLFTAILLAACAAWFSIVGIMTIFSGAALSVMIMAGVLEIGKLVSAAWLHYEWERINVLTRAYFTTAILILMFITSMGIFGYLSKAHIEQSVKAGGNNELQMQNLERQIARQQSIITDSEAVLSQLDSQVQTLIEYDRIRGPSGSIATRQGQAEERKGLNESIDVAYIRIEELQTELAPLQQEKLELEKLEREKAQQAVIKARAAIKKPKAVGKIDLEPKKAVAVKAVPAEKAEVSEKVAPVAPKESPKEETPAPVAPVVALI